MLEVHKAQIFHAVRFRDWSTTTIVDRELYIYRPQIAQQVFLYSSHDKGSREQHHNCNCDTYQFHEPKSGVNNPSIIITLVAVSSSTCIACFSCHCHFHPEVGAKPSSWTVDWFLD